MKKYDYYVISLKLEKVKDRELIDFLHSRRNKTETIRQALESYRNKEG